MKFNQKIEKSFSLTDGYKKWRKSRDERRSSRSRNLVNNNTEINTKSNFRCILEDLNEHNCTQSEICHSVSHRNIIREQKNDFCSNAEIICLSESTNGLSEDDNMNYMLGKVPLTLEGEVGNCPLDSRIPASRQCQSYSMGIKRNRRSNKSLFKKIKTRKKVGFTKQISNFKTGIEYLKPSAKTSERNLSANLKSYILSNMKELVDMSSLMKPNVYKEYLALKQGKQEVAQEMNKNIEDVPKILHLQLNLDNRKPNLQVPYSEPQNSEFVSCSLSLEANKDLSKPYLHLPKTKLQSLEFECLSFEVNKDLSPTCGDIYGADEVDNASFDTLVIERDCVHLSDARINSFSKGANVAANQIEMEAPYSDISDYRFNSFASIGKGNHGKFVANDVETEIDACVYSDSASGICCQNEIRGFSKMRKNSNESQSDKLCERNSQTKIVDSYVGQDLGDKSNVEEKLHFERENVKTEFPRIPSLRMISSNLHGTNNNASTSQAYENPWVLQTPSENIPKKFQELPHVEIEIESSLGFDVHHITNVKGNEFPVTGLVRSDSKQSIDSFSSSFHSVGSVQQLYFSDSEAEHNIDQISDDSNEFESDSSSSNMAETQSGHMPKSIGQVLNSSRDIDQVTSASAHMVEVTKDLRDRIQIMNSLNDNVQTTKSLSDSDSDEKQMFPYALAENFESKITARRKKKKLESKSFDEKLNKFHCSPERSTGNKMSKLIKSISLGASEERESKVDKKLTHFRRSLDSSLVQRDILNNIESPDKRKLVISNSTEFLSPVPETDVKIAKKDLHKRDGDHDNNLEPIRYFTLPNPKKLKSQQKLMKKKLSRLGSVSKLLSDKAQSLSNLKVGASFKLRKEIEKSKSLVSSSATSLSDLMTKKASSLSTLIRRRTNSNTIVESPFKQYTKKRNRIKDENKAEFVYEKIIVRVPAKRPVTKLEQKARAKWLCVCLRLAKNASRSEFERFDDETKSRSRSHSYLGRPWSSGSLSSLCTLRSPTMLDEIMKSVDAVRVRQQCSIGKDDMEASDDEDSSSGSSLFLFQKQYSFDTDTKSIKDSAFMAVCRVCGNIRHTSDGSTDSSDSMIARRLSGCYRYSLSLCNLNSTCQCLKQTQNQQYRLGGIVHQIEAETKQDANRRSWDIISDFKWTFPDSIIGDNVLRKSKISLPDYKRPVSMYDLRFVSDTMKDEQVELQTGDAESRDSIDSANALPGTLLRHRPVLDLSGENLDKTIDSEEGVIDGKSDSYTERSQSCGDLIDSERFYENEIRHIDLVNIKVKIEDEEDSYSYHSCSESVEMENDMNSFENEANEKQKSHSCSNLLDTKEVNLGDNLKLDEQIKKELRAMKVKSMSSSHDALNVLVPLETIDTDKIDKCLGPGNNKTDVICGTEVENGQCVMNNLNQWVQNGLNVEGKTDKLENSDNMTTLEFCNKVEQFTINEDDKENFVCEKCNCLRKKRNEVNSMMNLRLRNKESDNVVHEKLCTKPPLPRKNRRHVKVMSLTDISNHGNKDGNNVRDPKRFSMVELDKVNANISICTCENGNYKKDINEHEIKSDTTRTQNTAISGSLRKPVQRFLFDDHQVQSYIKTFTKCDRLKSISSDNVGSVDSPGHSGSHKLYSAQSLNRLSAHSWSDDVFNRLSFPLGPQLSPFADYFASTPVKGYSRFSGLSGITSPGLFQELPELPSLDEECVYKYDICLGYLSYSVQCDNKVICVYSLQRNKQLMESVISPLTEKTPQSARRKSTEHGSKLKPQHKTKLNEIANPAAPITNVPSDRLAHAGLVLRTVLMARAPHMIRDRKFHLRTYRRCMVGTEMVDWLLQQSALVHSRTQAVGMWQALVEEGVVVHVCHEHQFKDKYLFYRFHEDDEGVSTVQSSATKRECEEDLPDVFLMLAHIGPDAMMRMILRKPPHERTTEDLEIIYEELLHIKALSHLSTMVKRELASVLLFESHAKSGTVLFNQGDEGKSWYIILKGSVNVVIYGKGVVCTLHEGDDFGKLALVNDAPRAATIVMRDDNCHFLRVDKEDFNRILRDVEANTVRLKEHGQDVLVLEKIPSNTQSADGSIHAHYKYSVMAGTPEKMLEHLLESRMDNKNQAEIDGFLEDFLLTHVIFMPCNHQCPVLLSHYHSSTADTTEQEGFEFMLNHKKCVLHFVQEWANIVGVAFKEDHTINAFLEELHSCVQDDLQAYPTLKDDLAVLESILHLQSGSPSNKMKKRASGSFTFTRKQISSDCFQDLPKKRKPINPSAETILKIYCADHTYSTLKLPMDTKVEHLLLSTKEKLGLGDDLILCEVKSTGERVIFKENDLCVTTGLSINGQLFVTPKEHLDALTPLPEQEGPSDGSFASIEMYSSREMAYHMTRYDWDLFTCVQEYELIYQVFGRYKFGKITANLDLFLRRFNEIQFWIVTEMVLTCNLSKRVTLLRKFIKLAAHCKEFRNLNSFFAIVMGLSNIAVSRLSQTWEKLPSKFKKMFADFETLMDPSRNHRVYRLFVAKMLPPIIPFMPLLMKDMTFTHEGNKTYFDGLVNFEKMHMIAQTLKTVRFCRSARLDIEAPGTLKSSDTSEYIRSIKVIDNQRVLTQLSHKLEPRKT